MTLYHCKKNYLKSLALSAMLIISFIGLMAQEVQFPPSLVAAGGSNILSHNIHITKWRIGKIHSYNIESEDLKSVRSSTIHGKDNLDISNELRAYPNPVEEYLYLSFHTEKAFSYHIEVLDMSGKKILVLDKRRILARQTIHLDFSKMPSGLYLVHIRNIDLSINRSFRITKL